MYLTLSSVGFCVDVEVEASKGGTTCACESTSAVGVCGCDEFGRYRRTDWLVLQEWLVGHVGDDLQSGVQGNIHADGKKPELVLPDQTESGYAKQPHVGTAPSKACLCWSDFRWGRPHITCLSSWAHRNGVPDHTVTLFFQKSISC